MHFNLDVSLGNILTVAALLGVGWKIERFLVHLGNFLTLFKVEHNILVSDWEQRTGQKMPTRTNGMKI